MTNYPWLEVQKQWWLELLQKNTLPHAILLKGDKGLGKAEFSRFMAMSLLCTSKKQNRPCQNCSSCHLFKANNHLDFFSISAEKNIIKIDQIRKMSNSVGLSSAQGNYQVVVINDIEKLNKSSANALLKTLEEPSKDTVLILVSNEFDRVMPTIKSRCVKLDFHIPKINQSKEWLQDHSLEIVNEALFYSNGSPLLAKELIDNDSISVISSMLGDLESIKSQQVSVIEVARSWVKEEKIKFLKYLSIYFVNEFKSLLLCNNIESSTPSKFLNFNRKVALDFASNINKVLKTLNTPLKKELLIEELLVNWQNI